VGGLTACAYPMRRRSVMEGSFQNLLNDFWFSLAGTIICAVITFVLMRRRPLWLRLLDAEEAFWLRFGLPKTKGGLRTFAESRFFKYSFAFFTSFFFILAVVSIGMYFHFKGLR
jgi:hypothetical protein